MSNFLLRSTIKWFGQASFLVEDQASLYLDPVKIAFPQIGDVILITQNHPLHCDPEEVKWLRKGSTVIVCPEACSARFIGDVRVVKPGDKIIVKGMKVEVLPGSAASRTEPNQAAKLAGVGCG